MDADLFVFILKIIEHMFCAWNTKYGESFGYDYELLDNGYLISDYDIDLQLYSEEEINEAIKEMEDFEIEI